MRFLIILALIATATAGFAQESAKALFHDPTSGVTMSTPEQGRRAPASTRDAPASINTPIRASQPATQSVPEVTGLMYWVELQSERGQLLRVNSGRVFHSGERIRFHVTSNVGGNLTILQSQDGGPYTRLFPTKSELSGRMEALQPTVLPSKSTWFRFDDKPGDLRLMLMVQAGETVRLVEETVRVTGSRSTTQEERDLEANLRAQVERLKGSKALVVEEDSSPNEAANYAVVDTRREKNAPKGLVAVEVKLAHR